MNAHSSNDHRPVRPVVTRSAIVLLTAIISLTFVVSLAQASLDGRWNATDLQVQNADFTPAFVVVQYDKVNGSIGFSNTDVLPGQQSKVYSPTFQISGTVHVNSLDNVLGVVTHGDAAGNAEWPLIDGARLDKVAYVPHFVVQPSGLSARLTVHNLEPLPATVTVSFFNPNGVVIGTYTTALPAFGAKFLDQAAMGLPSTFQASARVLSNRKLYVGVDRLGDGTFAAAQAPGQAGYQLAAPLFTQALSGFDSTFAAQNASPVTATIVMTYFDQAGIPLSMTAVSLAPYAAFDWVGSVVHTATFGSVIATANQPIVALVLNDRTAPPPGRADYTALVIDPAIPDGFDRAVAYAPAILDEGNGWGSNIFVANPNPGGALVQIEYRSTPTGALFSTGTSIPPHGVALFPSSALPPNFGRAAAKISSNQIIAVAVRTGNPQLASGDALMMYEALYAPPIQAPEPALSVTTDAAPDPVQAGAPLTYTIKVLNTGNLTLTGLVTDLLSAHVLPTGILTWPLIDLSPTASWSKTVVVTVALGYAGPLTNVAQVTTLEGAAGSYTATTQAQVTPALSVTQQPNATMVVAGERVTYTLRMTNTGNIALSGIVTDTLPAHVTPTGIQTWTLANLSPGNVWTQPVIITVTRGYSGILINRVQVTTQEGAEGESQVSIYAIGYQVYLPVVLSRPSK